jgi:hypothetical protein
LAEIIDKFVDTVKKETGIKVRILAVHRSAMAQEAYYAQGRRSLKEVNMLRRVAGLRPIGWRRNRGIVTWTNHSLHQTDEAFDANIAGIPERYWGRVGRIAKRLGLRWGGEWKDYMDVNHFEIRDRKKMDEYVKEMTMRKLDEMRRRRQSLSYIQWRGAGTYNTYMRRYIGCTHEFFDMRQRLRVVGI